MSQAGGSLGCSEHANLTMVLNSEATGGGEGVKSKEALSSLTFLLHPKVGIDFPPMTAVNENFCVTAKASSGCVFLISLNMITCTSWFHG